ncbi:MAG: GNAT family N-acetyltransferase [Cytophagales bacterium]|nr:GNAT family N-acetyltransferase [Cytophagales bacterium]
MKKPVITPSTPSSFRLAPLASHAQTELFECITANISRLRKHFQWSRKISSDEDFNIFFNKELKKRKNGESLSFLIYHRNQLAGQAGIEHIDQENKKGDICFWVDQKKEGMGLAFHSLKIIFDEAFYTCGLNKVSIRCTYDNTNAQRLAERIGCFFEGIEREALLIDNSFSDHYIYTMFQKDWEEIKIKLEINREAQKEIYTII